jgi:hypothetical protein
MSPSLCLSNMCLGGREDNESTVYAQVQRNCRYGVGDHDSAHSDAESLSTTDLFFSSTPHQHVPTLIRQPLPEKLRLTAEENPGALAQPIVILIQARSQSQLAIRSLRLGLLAALDLLERGPDRPQLGNPVLPILLGIVGQMAFQDHTLPQGQVARVNGNSVIILRVAGTDMCPVTILFGKIQSGGVGDEYLSNNVAGESELLNVSAVFALTQRRTYPADDPELGTVINKVVQDGGDQSANFASGSRQTVGSSTNRNWVNFSSE